MELPGAKDYDQSYETLVKTLTGPDRLRLGAILFRGIDAKHVAAPWNESRWNGFLFPKLADDDYPMIFRVLTNRILPSTGFPVFQTHSASLIFVERPMVYRQQVGLQGQSFSICDPQHDGQADTWNFREVASRTKSRKECLQKIGETNMIN